MGRGRCQSAPLQVRPRNDHYQPLVDVSDRVPRHLGEPMPGFMGRASSSDALAVARSWLTAVGQHDDEIKFFGEVEDHLVCYGQAGAVPPGGVRRRVGRL